MTLAKLAEAVGTSISTVSKAFSGSREVSDTMRERIFRKAKEMGCFEKYYKRPASRPIIALIFPEAESEYYASRIAMLEREIASRGAEALVVLSHFNKERVLQLFSHLVYRVKVDGVIVAACGGLIKNPDEVPLISFTSTRRGVPGNSDNVYVDVEQGIDELVALIKEYGYKKIGYIGERLTSSRLRLLKKAMRRQGLPIYSKYIVQVDRRFAAGGAQGFDELVRRGDVPEVIVAGYDYIAYGAMKQAKSHGYRIPDDVCFASFDDLSTADYMDVPLTSVRTHTENVTKTLVDLLFKRIENRYYRERQEIVVGTSVILRESLCRAEDRAVKNTNTIINKENHHE